MNSLPPEYDSFLRPDGTPPRDDAPSPPPGDDRTRVDDGDRTSFLPTTDQDETAVIREQPRVPAPRAVPVIPAPADAAAPRTRQVSPSQPPTGPVQPPPAAPQRAPGPRKQRRRRRRRWFRWLLLAFVLYLVSLLVVFSMSVNRVDALPAQSSANSSGMNVLIVGSDSRAGLTEDQQNELTTGFVEGDRTDAIMLLHIPTIGRPTLVSIPRDSWVPIPGFGSDKINAAYALGGPQLLITTVEQVTGLEITDFVEVGFAGVANTTNALGGVTLCPVQDFNDEFSGLNVTAGCQTMDGPTALAYVRMRYQDPRGDLGRVERQQEFVAAVGKKAISPMTWLLPWRAYPTAFAAGESLTVSRGTNMFDITRIGVAMGMISFGWGTTTTVPTEDESLEIDGQSALKWDSPAASELFAGLE